jgi:hypothetical protein
MHLAEFILTNIEPLSREWEEFAKSCTPAAIGMTRSTLLDDVTQILQAIANDMEQPQDPAEQKAKGRGQPLSCTRSCRGISRWLANRIEV